MTRRLHFTLLLCLAAAAAQAQTPAAETDGLMPGKSTELTLKGATSIWTSFPAETTLLRTVDGQATWRITVPADATVGVAPIRVATKDGVSTLVPIMIDDLPTVKKDVGSDSAGRAQEISPPVAVVGVVEALRVDRYRFRATRGQRVAVEVVAARAGSALDPVLRIIDSTGHELAWADDSPGAAPDCRAAVTIPADGEYFIELRDVGYEGGRDHHYRLRVGDFPLATVPFPLGGRRETIGMFTLLGDGCDGVPPAVLKLPSNSKRLRVGGRRPGGAGSGFASVVASDLDETVEAEPNDTRDNPTPFAWPAALNGRLEVPGDVDFYKLAARKGERLAFRARTRSLGSPCDLAMQLLRADGTKVAASKVEGPAEAGFDVTVPDDGTYFLRAAEIAGAGGPALAYRVEVDRFRPGFSLELENDTAAAKPGGEFDLKVSCVRREYGGPITVSVDPAGVTAAASTPGATIPAGKQETQLKIKLAPDAAAGSMILLRIVGTATIDGRDVRATASTLPALRKQFPRMLYPPEELDGLFTVGVRGDGK
jgi:hypothetical protein